MEKALIEQDIIIKCKIGDMVKRFFKDYVVVWHDPNLDNNENQLYRAHLEKFCKVKTFTEWVQASIYVRGTKKICHVITSGTNGELLTREIYSRENVFSIYVFCRKKKYHSSWAKNYPKIACVEVLISDILNQIEQKLLEWFKQESSLKVSLPAFAPIFNDVHKSKMNNLHRYLKIIPKFKNREQAKKDFISLSKEIYTDRFNTKLITEFENNYNEYERENVLKWYTRESFLYKVANNCLRIATSDSIQYCRLILKDIQEAIKEQYQMKSKKFNGLLYRAAYLSDDEWSDLKENTGREIEMHGFLSASKNKNTALKFLRMDSCQKVFITIIVPNGPTEEEQGFAEIEEFSEYKTEEEVLFNVRSRFTILETDETSPEKISSRHLVLLYGAQGFRRFVSEKNPVQEVSIEENISCTECKVPSSEVSEKMMFVPIGSTGNDNYSCERCLPNLIELKAVPLLCVPFIDNTDCEFAKPSRIEIKGFEFIKRDWKIPFYGYNCSECQVKKQEMYFLCTTCDERGKRWCENCFKKKADCLKLGHAAILENNPFSFWCEQMSKKELNHLKVQNSLVPDSEFFQQAQMYSKSQEYEKAIEYYQAYIHKNGTENKDGNLIACFNNLGTIYRYLGDYKKALECHSQALDISLLVSCKPDSGVASSYDGLGNVFFKEKEYEKALEYHLKSLEIKKSLYGNTDTNVAVSLSSMARIYESMGEFQKAREYHLNSLDIERSIYGEIHPSLANSYRKIGVSYTRAAEYKKALDYHLKCLDIEIAIYGKNHTNVALSYENIGIIYKHLKDDVMAIKSLETSLDIRISVHENINPNVSHSYSSLGTIFQMREEFDIALGYFEKSLELNLVLYEENHPHIANSYQNIARAYCGVREYDKALEYQLKSLEIRKSLYGNTHPDIAESLHFLGIINQDLGKDSMALEYLLESLDIALLVYGNAHPDVAACFQSIGLIYNQLGNKKKALEYLLTSIDINILVYGENHLNISNSYFRLGTIYEDEGEEKEALECFLKTLDIRTVLFGENFLQTEEAQVLLNHITELANIGS